ncbi:hypothetical protein MFIFM68171_03662 [Madurella fahalii]|uniref:F-box domain-containing protein n=1 Tax=Madurella fahalii TaxID=1157608 RepID=A0ABQ0G6S1_9PEZI
MEREREGTGKGGVVYLVVGDLVTVGWNEEYLEILRREEMGKEEVLRDEKGDEVVDGDGGEAKAVEQLMEDGKSREARAAAPERVTSHAAEDPEPTTAKSPSDKDAGEPDYLSDSDDAFETLDVSAEKADQRRIAISAPGPRQEHQATIVQHHQHQNRRLPWLPNDPTQPLQLTLLRSIPNLPYKQNWMVNVLAVVVSLSDVQPAHIPPYRQRTALLADPSTTKQVHLATFLEPEMFTPDCRSVACHHPEPAKMPAKVYAVLCIAEIGEMIIGFLEDRRDVYNACLTSKSFYAAARSHLWQAVDLRDLVQPGRRFWERFSSELRSYTQSLYVDMKAAAPGLLDRIGIRPWNSHVCDPEWLAVKEDVDKLFYGLKETMKRSAHLRSFASRDVPRVLDLILLLHRYCPAIESISISACIQDSFGLCAHPGVGLQHWREQVGRGIKVPLANMVNLCLDPIIAPKFDFPSLRTLSLTDLRLYWTVSPIKFAPLFAILKASPNLTYLELTFTFQCGVIRPGNPSLSHGTPPHSLNLLLDRIWRGYHSRGGMPLHLKGLKLGTRCQFYGSFGPAERLHKLTDLACLEELHMEGRAARPTSSTTQVQPVLRFGAIEQGHLPRLRKLTWPWMEGHVVMMLHMASQAYFSQVTVRITAPAYPDWIQPEARAWFARYPVDYAQQGDTLRLHGLVLPSEHMTPQDTEMFMLMLPWARPMRSLKIRLPRVTVDCGDDKSNELFGSFAKMEELRELWLSDGLENSSHEQTDVVSASKEQLRALALKFAVTCAKLSYLRILDQAWHIWRTGPDDRAPELRPLLAWEVENKLPYAFDYRTPSRVK